MKEESYLDNEQRGLKKGLVAVGKCGTKPV